MGMSSLVFAFKQLFPCGVLGLFVNFHRFLYCDLGQCRPTLCSASNRVQVPSNTAGVMVRSPPQQMKHVATDLDPRTLSILWTFIMCDFLPAPAGEGTGVPEGCGSSDGEPGVYVNEHLQVLRTPK